MLKALSIFWTHKVGVVFFLCLVAIIGIFSALNIEKTMYPNTSLPEYNISGYWGNYSPEVMELKITAPIEREVSKLKYVKGIKSTSRSGFSTVRVLCDKGYNRKEFELLLNETRRKLEKEFARNVRLGISRAQPDETANRQSFLTYRIFSPISIDSLSRIVDNDIQTAISSISGVAEVNPMGLEKQAYFLTIKEEFRNMPRFSPNQISRKVRDYFEQNPASTVRLKENSFLIKLDSHILSENDLKNIPISKIRGRTITLGELAFINQGPELKRSITRFNGLEGITLDIKRQPDASAVSTSEKVQAKIEELSKKYKLTYQLISNEGEKVQQKLDDLFLRVLISLIVIFVIVFFITKQMYNSVVVMLLLILSSLFSIFGLYVTGNSINLTTIAGLALGFGMIIDNSLVVIERLANIPKQVDYKNKVLEAIKHIYVPVKVSTYTSIGAILPIFVMDELLKITLSPFVIALAFSLISSLIIAIVFLPLLIKENHMAEEDKTLENRFTHFILWLGKKKKTSFLLISMLLGIPGIPFYYYPVQNQIEGWDTYNSVFNTDVFKETIKPALNYAFGGAPFVYINDLKDKFSWGAFRGLNDEEEQPLTIQLRGPSGMKLSDMNTIVGKFEEAIKPYTHLVDYVYTQVSSSFARVNVYFTDEHRYDGTPEEVKEAVAAVTANFGGMDLYVLNVGDNIIIRGAGRGFAPSGDGALRYKLYGPDYEGLRTFAEKIEVFLNSKRRAKNISINSSNSRGGAKDQMEITLDEKLKPYEFEWVTNELNNIFTRDETQLTVLGPMGDESIYIKTEGQSLETLGDFNSLVFNTDSSGIVQLSKISKLTEQEIQGQIDREDQLYTRLVSFEYRASKNRIEKFKKKFEAFVESEIPEDIKYKEDLYEEEFAYEKGLPTWLVISITLLIVFAIVAMYFESYAYSFAIFLIIPFSLVGIIYFFFAMDEAIDSDAIFGLMFVAGIVINNAAFVLYEVLRKRRSGIEMNIAVQDTVVDRFRPVLLTTITTVVGILPLFLPQILTQVLDSYTIATLTGHLPEWLSNFMFKNTNKDPMWYAMSLSIISGTAASFFFSLWIPVVMFWKKEKKVAIP